MSTTTAPSAGGITLRFLGRALALRACTISEFSQRSGLDRNTVSAAIRGEPISARTYKRVIAALDLIPVPSVSHELGVDEALAKVGGPGS